MLKDGHLYGICGQGELRCQKADTGEQVWESDEVWGDKSYVFAVTVTLHGGQYIEVVDHVQHDDDLHVKRVTTYARPLASLQVLAERLADTHAQLTDGAASND